MGGGPPSSPTMMPPLQVAEQVAPAAHRRAQVPSLQSGWQLESCSDSKLQLQPNGGQDRLQSWFASHRDAQQPKQVSGAFGPLHSGQQSWTQVSAVSLPQQTSSLHS